MVEESKERKGNDKDDIFICSGAAESQTELDPESDPSLDPSVRFFGVDWQQIFARCFSLSINFRIFRAQVMFCGLAGSDMQRQLILVYNQLILVFVSRVMCSKNRFQML